MLESFRKHKSDKIYERVNVPLDKISWGIDYPEYVSYKLPDESDTDFKKREGARVKDFYATKHLPNSRHWSTDPAASFIEDPPKGELYPVSSKKFQDTVDIEGRWLNPNNENYIKDYPEYRKMKDRLYDLAKKYHFDFDNRGRPLNPSGRTGVEGLGLLWDWGPIFVTEGIVTREIEENGEKKIQIRLIRKWKDKENKIPDDEWKFPGGAVERGETVDEQDENSAYAASRELTQESGIRNVLFSKNDIVFDDYTESGRNTDNAWMISTAYHKHFKLGENIEEEDFTDKEEVAETAWVDMSEDDERFKKLSGSHKKMLSNVLEKLNIHNS
jgi:ADP-ribose pyrophosphatase